MGKLAEELGRILNLLEDAVEEQDWNMVNDIVEELNELYERLDREESGGYNEYYE